MDFEFNRWTFLLPNRFDDGSAGSAGRVEGNTPEFTASPRGIFKGVLNS